MSSDRTPRLTFPTLALTLLLVSSLTVACGRKEDPEPPPRKNPARTSDLKVAQRGQDLILTMSYPSTTQGGLALPGIDRLEIVRHSRPAPEFMEQPEAEASAEEGSEEGREEEAPEGESTSDPAPAATEGESAQSPTPTPDEEAIEVEDLLTEEAETSGSETDPAEEAGEPEGELTESGAESAASEGALGTAEVNPFLQIRVDPEEFRKRAEPVVLLEGAELQESVVAGKIVVVIPLAEIFVEPPLAYNFMARTWAGRLVSPDSNIASFVPLPAPPPPTELSLTPARQGILLTWSQAETEIETEGLNVYRRLPAASFPVEPLARLDPSETEYEDRSAAFGSKYVYALTTVRMKRPLVESALSEEVELAYSDDFPPLAPTGLVVLAEAGRIRLVWSPTGEVGVGYLVFVSRDGGEPQQLTAEPIRATEFVHEGTISGARYVYTVVAVDSAGNRSEASEEAQTRAP